MCGIHNKLLVWIVLCIIAVYIRPTLQSLSDVSIQQYEPARIGQPAILQCVFAGSNLDLQFVTWSKILNDGRTSFMYEYDACADSSTAFNELAGRATLRLTKPQVDEIGIRGNRIFDINAQTRVPRSAGRAGGGGGAGAGGGGVGTEEAVEGARGEGDGGYEGIILNDPDSGDMDPDIDDLAPTRGPRKKRELHDLMKTLTRMMTEENGGETDDEGGRGVATLEISDIGLDDEGIYECSVKVKAAAALSDTVILSTIVLPGAPRMDSLDKSPAEGEELKLTCRANIGKPAGKIIWSRQRIGEMNFWAIPEDQTSLELSRHNNGTSSAVSTVTLQIEAEDDGAIYKCESVSDALESWEELLFDHVILDVFYPPRNGKILYDSTSDRYYCHVQAKPAPSYVWLWVQEDGTKTIMSADQYLDMSSIQDGGYLRFRCLGSNIIHGVRHTSLMDTRLNVASKPEHEHTVVRTTPRPNGSRDRKWNEQEEDPVWDVVSADYGQNTNNPSVDTSNMLSNSFGSRRVDTEDGNAIRNTHASSSKGDADTRMSGMHGSIPYESGVDMRALLRRLDQLNNPVPPTPTPRPNTTPVPVTEPPVSSDFGDPMELFLDNLDSAIIDAAQRESDDAEDLELIEPVSDYDGRFVSDTNAKNAPDPRSRFKDFDDFDPYNGFRGKTEKLTSNEVLSTNPKFKPKSAEYQIVQRFAPRLRKKDQRWKNMKVNRKSASSMDSPLRRSGIGPNGISSVLTPLRHSGLGRNGISSLDSIKATFQKPKQTPSRVNAQRRTNFFNRLYGKSLNLPNLTQTSTGPKQNQENNFNELIRTTDETIQVANTMLDKQDSANDYKDFVHLPQIPPNFVPPAPRQNLMLPGLDGKDFEQSNNDYFLNADQISATETSNEVNKAVEQRNLQLLKKEYQQEQKPTTTSKLITLLNDPNPSKTSQLQLDQLLKTASLDELLEAQSFMKVKEENAKNLQPIAPKRTPTRTPQLQNYRPNDIPALQKNPLQQSVLQQNLQLNLQQNLQQQNLQQKSLQDNLQQILQQRNLQQQNLQQQNLQQQNLQLQNLQQNLQQQNLQQNLQQQNLQQQNLQQQNHHQQNLQQNLQQKHPQQNFQQTPLQQNPLAQMPLTQMRNTQSPTFYNSNQNEAIQIYPIGPALPPPRLTPAPPSTSQINSPSFLSPHGQGSYHPLSPQSPSASQALPPLSNQNFFNPTPPRPNLPLTGNYDAIHSASGIILRNADSTPDRPFNDFIHGVSDDPFSYRQQQPPFPKVFNAFKNGDDEIAEAHAQAFEAHTNSVEPQSDESYEDYDGSYADTFEVVTATSHKEYDCRRKNDGTYGGGCRAFYRCTAGDTFLIECKTPHVHNRRTGHCDEPKNAPSPCGDWEDCEDRDNGKYASLDNGCKSYFTCQGGVFLGHNSCTPGTIFDDREQVCNWPDAVPPPCGKGQSRKPRRRKVKQRRYNHR